MGIENTLTERGSRYGDFEERCGIAQGIISVMQAAPGWQRLNPMQRQALTVSADKVSRILAGDPNYPDNWHDLQGYARLVEERLPAAKATVPANDNLPEGFLPWNPHSGDVPPASETVELIVLRGGEVLSGERYRYWEYIESSPAQEIVGYKLHG